MFGPIVRPHLGDAAGDVDPHHFIELVGRHRQ
jgi:hypothetical protein